jgi:hypothetical protein
MSNIQLTVISSPGWIVLYENTSRASVLGENRYTALQLSVTHVYSSICAT